MTQPQRMHTPITRYVLGLVVVAATSALWAVLDATQSSLAWFAFAPVLLVLYLLGEWAFEPMITAETGHAVSSKRFSGLRIGVGLLLILPVFCVSIVVTFLTKAAL